MYKTNCSSNQANIFNFFKKSIIWQNLTFRFSIFYTALQQNLYGNSSEIYEAQAEKTGCTYLSRSKSQLSFRKLTTQKLQNFPDVPIICLIFVCIVFSILKKNRYLHYISNHLSNRIFFL